MIVGMTYDLKTEYVFKAGDPPDANAEFDHPDTVGLIVEAIAAMGHTVVRIGSARELVHQWDALKVDIVFNIAEGYSGRNREAQVPILLEMKGIPVVGSDGFTQALTLDKVMTKKILLSEGIPTPRFFEIASLQDRIPQDVAFPLIVKPRFEGSSKGLSERSLVHSVEELKTQTRWVIETYRQPALVEEFIRGNEFTVGIIGNEEPDVFPVVRIQIDGKSELGDLFYTFSRIAQGASYLVPAKIDRKLETRLQELAVRTYRAVECRDFGRVDFRVDAKGHPTVLEINPLPSLSTEDVFSIVATHRGKSYEQMIQQILETGIERWGLSRQGTRPKTTAISARGSR